MSTYAQSGPAVPLSPADGAGRIERPCCSLGPCPPTSCVTACRCLASLLKAYGLWRAQYTWRSGCSRTSPGPLPLWPSGWGQAQRGRGRLVPQDALGGAVAPSYPVLELRPSMLSLLAPGDFTFTHWLEDGSPLPVGNRKQRPPSSLALRGHSAFSGRAAPDQAGVVEALRPASRL